jgi:Fuc2NAc and GlcNAc transferase
MITVLLVVLVPGIAFIATIIFAFFWKKAAIYYSITSIPNKRTLHVAAIPVGGGIAIFLGWTLAASLLLWVGALNLNSYIGLVLGGSFMSVIGLIDDAKDLSARLKLLAQIVGTIWCVYWFGGVPPFYMLGLEINLGWIGYPVAGIVILWLINLLNFMDGADGMLASCMSFIGICIGSFLVLEGDYQNAALLYSLSAASMGFLVFNWPPASMFMGDAGSIFFGLCLPMLIISTLSEHSGLFWVWIIICGYILTDTTTTLILRLIYVRPFLDAHRQHAYQSLAYRSGDHWRVTMTIITIQILWLLPIACLAYWFKAYGALFSFLALTPIAIFSAKNGVLYEIK